MIISELLLSEETNEEFYEILDMVSKRLNDELIKNFKNSKETLSEDELRKQKEEKWKSEETKKQLLSIIRILQSGFFPALEFLIAIPFLVRLFRIRKEWEVLTAPPNAFRGDAAIERCCR